MVTSNQYTLWDLASILDPVANPIKQDLQTTKDKISEESIGKCRSTPDSPEMWLLPPRVYYSPLNNNNISSKGSMNMFV